MSVVDKAVEHFRERLADLKSIQVPEWDETIYLRPVTLAEQDEIRRLAEGKSGRMVAAAIVIRSRTADGKRMFKTAELGELHKKADPELMAEIIFKIRAAFDDGDGTDEEGEVETVKKP